MQGKQDEDIRERLCGKRILALGPESDMKRKFIQAFRNAGLEISEDAEDISSEDYVILFGFSDEALLSNKVFAGESLSEQAAAERGSERKTGNIQEKEDRAGNENPAAGWEMFSFLTRILCRIEDVRPKSVLFVSRADVYGKLFGEFHPVKEDEMGYVCHTDMQDQEAFRLRILENLCFRIAREDKAAVKIVRFPYMRAGGTGQGSGEYGWKNDQAGTGKDRKQKAGGYGQQSAGRRQKWRNAADNRPVCQDWGLIARLTAKILLDGAAGEVYNADGALRTEPAGEYTDTTALEPIRIVMDTGKAGKLG